MGLMQTFLDALFGGNRNVIRETAEVFLVNAEAQADRDDGSQERALRQFAEEFTKARAGTFDRFMDGLNRVPRPALALGTLALFVCAMVDPEWFAARMAGLALVPEPLWWLLGAIVSFYFGARHQAKGQALQRDILATLAAAPLVAAKTTMPANAPEVSEPQPAIMEADDTLTATDNPALDDWRASRR